MNKIFFIVLMLVGFSIQAQQYLLKERFTIKPNGDTLHHYMYKYDESYQISHYYRLHDGDTISMVHYENDTVVLIESLSSFVTYEYFDDSIVAYLHTEDTTKVNSIYYLDEQDRVIRGHFPGSELENVYQIWEGENIIEQNWTFLDEYTEYQLEYSSFLNPLYPFHRIIRWNLDANFNQLEYVYDSTGNLIRNYEVIESIGDYPTLVRILETGYETHSLYHIITNTSEITPSPAIVLSIDYYDIMGRKIEKPKKGFYIQRELTDKGVISTKHYKQ